MASFWTTSRREGDEVPTVIRVQLREGAPGSDWTPCFDLSAIGQQAYTARWWPDFLKRYFRRNWREALREQRERYIRRLGEIECTASK